MNYKEFQQMSCEEFDETQKSSLARQSIEKAGYSFSSLGPEEISIGLLIPKQDDDGLESDFTFIHTVTKIIHGFIMNPEDTIVNTSATLAGAIFFITILLQRLSSDHAAKEYFKNYCEESPFPANHFESIKEEARLANQYTHCLTPNGYYSARSNDICDKCKIPLYDYYKLRCAQELMEKSLSLGLRD